MGRISCVEVIVRECGFSEWGCVDIHKLKFYREVRKLCEENVCRNYGTSWACPPAIGTLEECKARVNQFDQMLLFCKSYPLEDSFDFEGMTAGLRNFKRMVDSFGKKLKDVLPEYLLLSNEGCDRCTVCTYPHVPCRFPDLLHHSLEGYGFVVSELATEAGIRYNHGANTVTFFGALLFHKQHLPAE